MKSHRGISFLSVQESSPPSVEASLSLTFHISPFSGRSAGKRQALCRQWCLWGRLLGVVGPGLPLRAVCKWSWTWEIGGQCQVSLVLFQVLWNQIESATKAAPRGACGGGVCAHRAVWLVHCRLACARPGETSGCLSLPRSLAPDGTTRASKQSRPTSNGKHNPAGEVL